ncbi:hypothetical protein NLU13_9356 [Sarocladium strictum]|uniref:Translation initiation factor IF-3 n=1 Tax=Sarocladium strictum TaxID=5046 RepID=A0AA39GA02_SARSR|nr:hypothetical protein NLU13_9356 [Sarocladium strictum]
MKPSPCLYSSQRALYRVFIRPATTTIHPLSLHAWHLTASPVQQSRAYAIRRSKRNTIQQLSPSEQVAQEESRKHDPRYTTAADVERSGRARLPRDHEITDPQIMVHERDVIEGPLRTQFVMTRIEPHESLRMVSPYVPATKDAPAKYAVCRIVNKKEEFEKEKQKKAQQQAKKQKAVKEKEVEINWGTAPNDLQTKIGTLTRLLGSATKVTVSLGKKKGSKAELVQDDMKNLVQKIKDEVMAVGGREIKPQEGSLGGNMKLYFASKLVNG